MPVNWIWNSNDSPKTLRGEISEVVCVSGEATIDGSLNLDERATVTLQLASPLALTDKFFVRSFPLNAPLPHWLWVFASEAAFVPLPLREERPPVFPVAGFVWTPP
jgi:hypothetical protein